MIEKPGLIAKSGEDGNREEAGDNSQNAQGRGDHGRVGCQEEKVSDVKIGVGARNNVTPPLVSGRETCADRKRNNCDAQTRNLKGGG